MAKQLAFSEEARNHLTEGIETLAAAVDATTSGWRGQRMTSA